MGDNYIILYINYGGRFVQSADDLTYKGGCCQEYHGQDVDKLSYFELKWHAKNIGLLNVKEYYYHIPKLSLFEGLRKVVNDDDAIDMMACGRQHGKLDLYFEGGNGNAPIPRTRLKEKFDFIDDLGYMEDNEENDEEDVLEDEDDEEDFDTSDEEYSAIKTKVSKFKQEKAKELDNEKEEWVASMGFGTANTCLDVGSNASLKIREGFQSEYEESEDEMNTSGSEIDDLPRLLRKKKKLVKVDEHSNFKTLKWEVGMTFPTRENFKECIRLFALAQGYNLKINVSDSTRKRVGAICKDGCKFKVYASWERKRATYVIRTVIDHHICTRTFSKNRQLRSSWVAKYYLMEFKDKPHWPAKEIIASVKKDFCVCINKWVAYSIKYGAHNLLHGSMLDHYSKVGRYLRELIRSNEGKFVLCTNPNVERPIPVFQRLFVCFEGIKQGLLEGCRHVMCIDACFLKTFLGGTLLSAVGIDGNNQMFPIAWAVAEGENNDSWEWFMTNVKACLGGTNPTRWTFISDEHKSIIHAISYVFPNCEHRHCARHIYANWKKVHKGEELKILFWNAAKAYNETDFKEAINFLKVASPKAAEAFLRQNPRLFCRAFMRIESKCDVIVNNMAETFNAYIVPARSKHLIYMLEDIRVALMERLATKKAAMLIYEDDVCPRVRTKLALEIIEARNCNVRPSTDTVFQVDHKKDIVRVCLSTSSCTCRKWDISGIPCCHAVACLSWLKKSSYDPYIHHYFKKSCYLRAYGKAINPCTGDRHWPECDSELEPPQFKIGPGRPRRSRRRDPHEDPKRPGKLTRHGVQMGCKNCKQVGHNSRGCPKKQTAIPSAPHKRPVGRPRKYPRLDDSMTNARGRGGERGRGRGRGSGRGGAGTNGTSPFNAEFEGINNGVGCVHGEIGNGNTGGVEAGIGRGGAGVGSGRSSVVHGRRGGARGTRIMRGGAGTRRGLLWWIDGSQRGGSGNQNIPATSMQ